MTDRPIIFSAPMVRALLEGRKTQTRRLLNRLAGFGPVTEFGVSDTRGYDWHFRDPRKRWNDLRDLELLNALPFRAGERLWVREAWADLGAMLPSAVIYRAEHPKSAARGLRRDAPWLPSIHMPRWASRLTLTVTGVQVERLNAITETDAVAEGVIRYMPCQSVMAGRTLPPREMYCYDVDPIEGARLADAPSARAAYELLWESIHGADSWASNPWVAALTFTIARANIDTPP